MTIQVFNLLGGFAGPDGYIDSEGMEYLGQMIEQQVPNAKVSTFTWSHWQSAIDPILGAVQRKEKVVVIGYSGGGSRATYLADALFYKYPMGVIDLMVLYDPSPKWEMEPIGGNVLQAICYHNTNPMMWFPLIGELGGGQLTGHSKIRTIDIAQQHLAVQENQDLHKQTIAAIKAL